MLGRIWGARGSVAAGKANVLTHSVHRAARGLQKGCRRGRMQSGAPPLDVRPGVAGLQPKRGGKRDQPTGGLAPYPSGWIHAAIPHISPHTHTARRAVSPQIALRMI
jgi:hypothetical protein